MTERKYFPRGVWPISPNSRSEEDSIATHQPLHRQGKQDVKVSHPSKPPRLTDIVCFITAAAFIIAGMLICILNIVNIISGPWSAIIGVLFAGIGLIVAFYVLFIQRTREGETETR